MKRANPQGKGLVPALQAWHETRPATAGARSISAFLSVYCASSLVLAARFDFRPVPGNRYYLYQCDDGLRLSLIAPAEWGERRPGVHVANCDLQQDMTWLLEAAEDLAEYPAVVQALERHVEAFVASLDTDGPLVDRLPFHVAELPFYPRLFASALARSLRSTLHCGGLEGASGRRLLHAGRGQAPLLQMLAPTARSAET